MNATVSGEAMESPDSGSTIFRYSIYFLTFCLFVILVFLMRGMHMDDAYIGYRIVDNAVHGFGWTFNPGERIEAATNIGWLFVLYLPSLFLPVPIAAKIIAVLAIMGSMILVVRLGNKFLPGKYRTWSAILPLLILTNFDYTFFSISGMETAWLGFTLCLMAYLLQYEKYRYFFVFGCAYCFLIHPETILIVPIGLLVWFVSNPADWRKLIRFGLLFEFLILIVSLSRYLYYGAWLPNTFLAKPPQSMDDIYFTISGSWLNIPNISGPFSDMLIVTVLIAGVIVIPSRYRIFRAFSAGVIVTVYVFCLYTSNDWTGCARYFAPYVPICYLFVLVGGLKLIEVISSRFPKMETCLNGILSNGVTFFIAIKLLSMAFFLHSVNLQRYPNYVMTGQKLVSPSKWIGENLPEDAVIATRRIGAISYYSGRKIFDYKFGLPHRDVAQRVRKHKRYFESPDDPYIRDLWQKYNPDYFLEDIQIVQRSLIKNSGDTLLIQGDKYKIIKQFPIGLDVKWTLCQRWEPPPVSELEIFFKMVPEARRVLEGIRKAH